MPFARKLGDSEFIAELIATVPLVRKSWIPKAWADCSNDHPSRVFGSQFALRNGENVIERM